MSFPKRNKSLFGSFCWPLFFNPILPVWLPCQCSSGDSFFVFICFFQCPWDYSSAVVLPATVFCVAPLQSLFSYCWHLLCALSDVSPRCESSFCLPVFLERGVWTFLWVFGLFCEAVDTKYRGYKTQGCLSQRCDDLGAAGSSFAPL